MPPLMASQINFEIFRSALPAPPFRLKEKLDA